MRVWRLAFELPGPCGWQQCSGVSVPVSRHLIGDDAQPWIPFMLSGCEFFNLEARPGMAGHESGTQVPDSHERVRACTGLAIEENHGKWLSSQALNVACASKRTRRTVRHQRQQLARPAPTLATTLISFPRDSTAAAMQEQQRQRANAHRGSRH